MLRLRGNGLAHARGMAPARAGVDGSRSRHGPARSRRPGTKKLWEMYIITPHWTSEDRYKTRNNMGSKGVKQVSRKSKGASLSLSSLACHKLCASYGQRKIVKMFPHITMVTSKFNSVDNCHKRPLRVIECAPCGCRVQYDGMAISVAYRCSYNKT